jgi:hypothetical protein
MSLAHTPIAAPPGRPERAPIQAYVIEIGETQAGLVSRAPHESAFTFIAASSAFHRLEGQRFATPLAAEQAARLLAAPRRVRYPL